jgi:hypothetical protein
VQDYGVDQVGDIRGRRQVALNQCVPRPDGLPVEASRCTSPAVACCVGRIGVPNYTTGYFTVRVFGSATDAGANPIGEGTAAPPAMGDHIYG